MSLVGGSFRLLDPVNANGSALREGEWADAAGGQGGQGRRGAQRRSSAGASAGVNNVGRRSSGHHRGGQTPPPWAPRHGGPALDGSDDLDIGEEFDWPFDEDEGVFQEDFKCTTLSHIHDGVRAWTDRC